MDTIDYWLDKAHFYKRIGKPHMAVRSLRIAAQCRPSFVVGNLIQQAIAVLEGTR